jgi:hypothetical protein
VPCNFTRPRRHHDDNIDINESATQCARDSEEGLDPENREGIWRYFIEGLIVIARILPLTQRFSNSLWTTVQYAGLRGGRSERRGYVAARLVQASVSTDSDQRLDYQIQIHEVTKDRLQNVHYQHQSLHSLVLLC